MAKTRRELSNQYPIVNATDGKLTVKISDWICDLLFNKLDANYSPARGKRTFDRNLDAGRAEILTYLGTYFPRSLAETFVIFDSLLADKHLAKKLSHEPSISVCSIGSGTGGDFLGLLLAIDKRLNLPTHVDAVSIEGNAEAHETMRCVIDGALSRLRKTVDLQQINHVFQSPEPFGDIRSLFSAEARNFDFVITSKMLNELDGSGVSERPYYEFCDAFTGLLKPTGVLLVLDITSPNGTGGRWTPKALNGQVNEFLSDNANFRSVLPLLCNRFEPVCSDGCYTQNVVCVSYQGIANECSKICYRVIGSTELAEKLSGSTVLWDCPITKDNMEHCGEFNREA